MVLVLSISNLSNLRVFWPERRFVTPEFFLITGEPILTILHMHVTNTYTKECIHLLTHMLRWFEVITKWSKKKIDSFLKDFFRTLRFPSSCIIFFFVFLSKKTSVVILWQLRQLDWFVNNAFCTWYTLLLCPFISKSDSSAVKSSPRNSWIEGSNPGRNYTSVSVSHFVP